MSDLSIGAKLEQQRRVEDLRKQAEEAAPRALYVQTKGFSPTENAGAGFRLIFRPWEPEHISYTMRDEYGAACNGRLFFAQVDDIMHGLQVLRGDVVLAEPGKYEILEADK